MGRARQKQKLPQEPVEARVTALSHDGRGVARIDGKVVFIHGALPGETTRFRYTGRRKSHDEGEVVEVLQASEQRAKPGCDFFGLCGGCSLQHLQAEAQIQYKQQTLLDAFSHIGKILPEQVLPPLVNHTPWGYRRKARLGVKHVLKKGRVLVGFRERNASFVADMDHCEVLHPKIGHALADLSRLVESLTVSTRVPQIEVAMDDARCVLIFRILEPLTDSDKEKLRHFSQQQDFVIYLQEGGPDTVMPLGEEASLRYALPDFGLELCFQPTDFTQINTDINRQMIKQAVDLLALSKDDRVLDLFCGIGNFTLPMATRAGQVTGVEAAEELVARAKHNARNNQLDNVSFYTANLYESLAHEAWLKQSFNKVVLDPPRSGAFEVLAHLPGMGAERIVYVSCYPGTLARDAAELVNVHGYRLVSAGVMDMFPHTAHVESIALFEKG